MPKPVVIPIKPLTSWSFSRYSDYKQCPAKFKYKHLMKLPEPKSSALERGAAIHTMAEQYIKGVLAKLPKELASFDDEFKALRKHYKKTPERMVVEDNWAFTRQWVQTEWNDWDRCWVRIKLDCAHRIDDAAILTVRDWKTGKLREELYLEYLEQLELYALAAFLLYPEVQEVRPELDYLDLGVVHPTEPLVFKRADLPRLKQVWEDRVVPMFKDQRFAPRPNDKCHFCAFSRAKGGPCQY